MKKQDLLTINQLARVCSTSRSSLLRMEEDGILIPVYTDPESGYRYYDDSSVFLVNMNLSLHDAGISHKEILDYYHDSGFSQQMLSKLEARLHTLEYHVANLRLQIGNSSGFDVCPYVFPETDCYVRHVSNVKGTSELSSLIKDTLHHVIQSGYRLSRHLSPFETFDLETPGSPESGYEYDICIPVLPTKQAVDLIHFDSLEMISSMLYGGPSDITSAVMSIQSYATKNGLPLVKTGYVIGIMNSFPASSPSANAWVTQVCIPLTDRK